MLLGSIVHILLFEKLVAPIRDVVLCVDERLVLDVHQGSPKAGSPRTAHGVRLKVGVPGKPNAFTERKVATCISRDLHCSEFDPGSFPAQLVRLA